MINIEKLDGFEWDKGNLNKNWKKHEVTHRQAEEVFQNSPLVITETKRSPRGETRFAAYGPADDERFFTVIYIHRKMKIRIISARDMSRKERKFYEKFKNEDEERDFWDTHDVTDYFDMEHPIINPKFPNLKYSTKTISLRMPVDLLDDIKIEANKRDVPYQSYMKMLLHDKIHERKADYGGKRKKK